MMNTRFLSSDAAKQELRYEIRSTLGLAAPLVVSMLIQTSMSFVDTVMTGNRSGLDLAATSVGHYAIILFVAFGMGILTALQPIISQKYGAREEKPAIGKVVVQGIVIGQILAWTLVFIAGFAHRALPFFGVEPVVAELAAAYIRAFSFGFPAFFMSFALYSFYSGITNTRIQMYINIGALGVNIFGNYVLVFGRFGFPELGAVGAGYTSALASWLGMIALVTYTLVNKKYRDYRIFRQLNRIDLKLTREIIRIGVPIAFSMIFEGGLFCVFALLTAQLGLETVAGNQIALNFASLTFMIPLSLSHATAIRVGNYIGEGKLRLAEYSGWLGYALSIVVMSVTALVMISFPRLIASVYTIDPAVQEVAAGLLIFAGIFQLSDGVQVAGMGALKGFKDTKIPMLVNLVSYWFIGMALGYYLCFYAGFGARGLWTGMIVGLTTAAVMHTWRFKTICRGNRESITSPNTIE